MTLELLITGADFRGEADLLEVVEAPVDEVEEGSLDDFVKGSVDEAVEAPEDEVVAPVLLSSSLTSVARSATVQGVPQSTAQHLPVLVM